MNVDPKVRELLTCALLHLDPRIVDKRVALNSVLVEVALLTANRPCSLEELRAEIDKVVNQGDFLHEEDLRHAVEDCTSRRTVVLHDEKYELSTGRSRTLQEAFLCADETRRRVCDGLIVDIELEISRPLSSGQAPAICESIERALAARVYDLSLQLARQNLIMEEMLLQLEAVEALEDLERTLDEHFPPERQLLRQQIKRGIKNYFQDFPPELEKMLRLIHHNVLINQILNLDPSMVRMQREWFSRRRLYLDTNAVLAYIFEGQLLHSVVLEVIQATANLGAQLLISPVTLEEVSGQVSRAKQNHFRYERDPFVKRMAASGDDAILATFAQLKRNQPSLEWEAFIAPFDALPETLLDYNVLVESEGFERARNADKLPQIRRGIADAKPPGVSENVIEHDSLNCALISLLREEIYPPDERGQTVWLLTIDSSLRTSQKRLLASEVISSPYCAQAQEWGEIVLPAQSLLGFVFDDFIGYLAQTKLGAIADPQIVQIDFLETIQDAGVEVDRLLRLHPDQVRATLVRLQTSREARALVKGAVETEDESQKQTYQQQMQLMVDEIVEETDPVRCLKEEYDRKINLLRQRLEERDHKIAELDARVANAESTWAFRVSTWLRQVLGRG
jgi:predicted nucleic acid-binding protein